MGCSLPTLPGQKRTDTPEQKKSRKEREFRRLTIEILSMQVAEYANANGGGCSCTVPSASKPGMKYRVNVDENYRPVSCNCQGGKFHCQHKQAVIIHFQPLLKSLLNDEVNPRYQFQRNGKMIVARLSQFSRQEKKELRENEAAQAEQARRDVERFVAEAAKREIYSAMFDPNGIDSCLYA